MPVMLEDASLRDPVRKLLSERHAVQTSVLYPSINEFTAYGGGEQSLPRCERAARTQLTLPLYPHLGEERLERVVEALRASLAEAPRPDQAASRLSRTAVRKSFQSKAQPDRLRQSRRRPAKSSSSSQPQCSVTGAQSASSASIMRSISVRDLGGASRRAAGRRAGRRRRRPSPAWGESRAAARSPVRRRRPRSARPEARTGGIEAVERRHEHRRLEAQAVECGQRGVDPRGRLVGAQPAELGVAARRGVAGAVVQPVQAEGDASCASVAQDCDLAVVEGRVARSTSGSR